MQYIQFLATALVLARADRGEEHLERRITFSERNLVPWSPVTEKRVADGMTMAALCEAAMTASDNAAANLMLESFGGPAGLTAFMRSLGDEVTRLDRIEPELNQAAAGDPRDTTTPRSMLDAMGKMLLGNVLQSHSRERLVNWMIANRTGGERLRKGFPPGWRTGDKTGSGMNGAANDIAILWPPQRQPVLVAAYFAESSASAGERDAVLAEVGRIVTETAT